MEKIALIWEHFNPDSIYLVKGEEAELNDLAESSDWLIEDVTGEEGLYLVGHDDENCMIYKIPFTSKEEAKSKLIEELNKLLEESRKLENEDDEYELESLGGLFWNIDDTSRTAEDIADEIFDWIDDSYVDGDSASQYEFMTISKNEAIPLEEIVGEEDEE